MSKLKRSAKPSRKPKAARRLKTKRSARQTPTSSLAAKASTDCPYRPGTLYGTLFSEGNKDYIGKDELLKRVAELTGKSEKVVGFAYQVLKSKGHRSNKNRSTELVEADKVKLIPIRK